MFPLWEVAVAPVLESAGARNLVEIGALRGENTRQIIDRLGPETVLHVIDPLPDFDPAVHEAEFAGQYVFHRDLSLNVLGDLAPMDAALIDGDHNWYTVFNELRLLAEVSRAHDAPLPVMILHDVAWPYGRRDLYYDPTNIPDEFRKEWALKGMEPDKKVLVPFGAGLNPTLANAMVEGGRRNGVRTGLDDFVASHDRPLRQVVLPIYFGLAIVVEQERLDRNPALAAVLDHLESPEGLREQLQVAEDIRIAGLIFQHKIYFDRDHAIDRLARRYLRQVRDGVAGASADSASLDALDSAMGAVRADLVLGSMVAVGADPPGSALYVRAYLEAFGLPGRQLWVVGPHGSLDAGLAQLDLESERTRRLGDLTAEDLATVELPEKVALIHLGSGVVDQPEALLDDLYQRLSHDGIVMTDANPSDAVRTVLAAWRERVGASGVGDAVGEVGWRKVDREGTSAGSAAVV